MNIKQVDPFMIEVALHYWTKPGQFKVHGKALHELAPHHPIFAVLALYEHAGLLQRDPLQRRIGYRATPALGAYVASLCRVPPIEAAISPFENFAGQTA
jgi:hypothetical protein